jgi:hypothetical protein
MLERDDLYMYECAICRKTFRLMSALVKHTEFQYCDKVLDHDPLKKFCKVVALNPFQDYIQRFIQN